MRKTASWLLVGLCTAVAAGGYFQVSRFPVFWCGRVEAFPGTTLLSLDLYRTNRALSCSVRVAGLGEAVSPVTDIVLPFLLIGLLQVFAPHPRTVIFLALLAAIPATLSRTRVAWRWTRAHLVPISALFIVSALGFWPPSGSSR